MADTFTMTQTLNNKIKTIVAAESAHIWKSGVNYYWTGGNQIFIGDFGNGVRRGFAEWDISELPKTSTINAMKFLYHGDLNQIDCRVHKMTDFQPSTAITMADSQSIYDSAGTDTIYSDVANFPVDASNQNIFLGTDSTSSACVDLTSQVTNSFGWFAIGIQSDNEASVLMSKILSIEASSANPKPSLYIDYTYTSTCTLTQPYTIRREYTRKTESHLFPDGTFNRHDIGSGGKTITMQGTEISTASTRLACVDTIMSQGEYVTLSGMNNAALNTDWYITDFTWNQNEAYVDRYDWTLSLKET